MDETLAHETNGPEFDPFPARSFPSQASRTISWPRMKALNAFVEQNFHLFIATNHFYHTLLGHEISRLVKLGQKEHKLRLLDLTST